jgi:AraC family transcriptional regulator
LRGLQIDASLTEYNRDLAFVVQYDRHVRDVELLDVLRTDDSVLSGIAAFLARESREGGLGGRLYVDSLKNQACVHMLRHYANVIFREPASYGGLCAPNAAC